MPQLSHRCIDKPEYKPKYQDIQRHTELLEWFTKVRQGIKPRSRIELWPRSGGKTKTIGRGLHEVNCGGKPQSALWITSHENHARRLMSRYGRECPSTIFVSTDRFRDGAHFGSELMRSLGQPIACVVIEDVEISHNSLAQNQRIATQLNNLLERLTDDTPFLTIDSLKVDGGVIEQVEDRQMIWSGKPMVYREYPAAEHARIKRETLISCKPTWPQVQDEKYLRTFVSNCGKEVFEIEMQHK